MFFLQGDYKKIKGYCNDLFGKDYFEFEFTYVSENDKFKEIDRFLWESRHECTRYKNKYYGNLVIGLNEWNENEPNKYFEAFMYFLKDYLRYAHSCIFFVEAQAGNSLISAVEKYFDLLLKELPLTVKKEEANKKIGFCIEVDEKEKENVRIKIQ